MIILVSQKLGFVCHQLPVGRDARKPGRFNAARAQRGNRGIHSIVSSAEGRNELMSHCGQAASSAPELLLNRIRVKTATASAGLKAALKKTD